ncbi:hypothetical protein B0T18DRAFT_312952 [Schizothecium vesticola]|uniref:Uncharacterized protein n=1 Tax=Schizothecium vesticola TaxID=314040 RepID=A0AA40FAD9_9PEZI|nr:hypothetical protein B0T18DRAFT_312952 [Schizothecium vesticola]
MSAKAPLAPVSGNAGDAGPARQSTLYKLIITPLIFVSFLISLTIIDLRHSARRAHFHSDHQPERPGTSRFPLWLHRIIYHRRQDAPPSTDEHTPPVTPWDGAGDRDGYYHSKQRELMKMMADEAFEIRSAVLMALVVGGLGVLVGVWKAVGWGVGVWGGHGWMLS